MTVRPPTLRAKRRYVLARIFPSGYGPDQKDLYFAVFEAVTSLWGDSLASLIQPAVVAAGNGYAIVRCLRGMERELGIALSTVTSCSGQPVTLRSITTSGTIDSLRSRIHAVQEEAKHAEMRECTFDRRDCTVAFCEGDKVDVIEKGFKNTARFYLTTEDLEER
ncbi:MAG: Ribonuclease P protein component 2 [Methanoregula sp. PtaU1.Bin051]|nr:MAG: Ribonuclease P protein component 2 [Methanoregula sp. PtaU1.Bin051]